MIARVIRSPLGWVLLLALAVRLISLGVYPLMDTTEARYGNMARLMVETGNWLTPQFDLGVPFWGKPPLHTWMSAGSAATLGMSEFALRLPHWLAGVAVLALMALFARRQGLSGLVCAMVLATCVIFAIAAGAVMTDIALTLGMTLAMVGFYLGWQGRYRAGYLGFVGLAVGLLAKGPLVIVLVGLAVVPFLIWQHRLSFLKVLWQRFPLVGGTAAMLVVAAPWYLAAEQATPGFLNYFLVGEHFLRFVESGWQGDLYGSAHDQPRGTIWVFWLMSALPWSLVLPGLWWCKGRRTLTPLQVFALCWMVSPMVLFTFAGNILPAYVLPGVPALALLVASMAEEKDQRWLSATGMVLPLLLTAATLVLHFKVGEERSDKALLAQAPGWNQPLYYLGKRTFSGQYYSGGRAELVADADELAFKSGDYFLVLPSGRNWRDLGLENRHCVQLASARKRSLLECRADVALD
ncbi:ArnT family glycosyltransferase [Ferrimonas sp.]|uniref:ArnT family glycosyltransferase n=1 Tax=Ferrimonas sp. TaxID=2080861 RepID=UPI003A933B4E